MLGQLYQFEHPSAFAKVWLVHYAELKKSKESDLFYGIINSPHAFYTKNDLNGCVAELIADNKSTGTFWFPAQNSYTIMPLDWFREI